MAVYTKSFATMVNEQAANIQGSSATLIDFSVGAVMLAMVESNASVCMWLQGIVLQTLTRAYAATSCGPVLDTWMTDFDFIRLPGAFSTGQVTFSTPVPAVSIIDIPINTVIQTASGIQFETSADAQIAIGQTSVTVGAIALVEGTSGNITAGSISQIQGSIIGVTTVTNSAPFTGGLGSETDPAFRSRFQNYFNGNRSGNDSAIGAAIAGVQQGLFYNDIENPTITTNLVDAIGNGWVYVISGSGQVSYSGYIWVAVDDGTGSVPMNGTLITNVLVAIGQVVAKGIRYSAQPCVDVDLFLTVTLNIAASGVVSIVQGNVSTALFALIGIIQVGVGTYKAQLIRAILDADPNVIDADVTISSISVNGSNVTSTLLSTDSMTGGQQILVPVNGRLFLQPIIW